MRNLKQIMTMFLLLAFLFAGCNRNESKQTGITVDGVGIKSSDRREDIYQDDDVKITRIVTGSDDFYYLARIKAKSISGRFNIDLKLDSGLEIISAQVLSYVGGRGRGVMRSRFTNQFAGKDSNSKFVVGKDIQAVTGATASAKTMSESIRRAIGILKKSLSESGSAVNGQG